MKINGKIVSDEAYEQARELAAVLNRNASRDSILAGEMGKRRIDANETNMLALSLEQMRATVYEEKIQACKAREMFPVESDIDPAADTFAYVEEEAVASFTRVNASGHAVDHKTAEVSASKVIRGLESYGGSYIVTMRELARAAFAGRPIETRKAMACRKAWEIKLDEVIAKGDASPGSNIINGAANRPLGSGAGQTQNTAVTTADWAAGTANAQNMLDDLMLAVREFVQASKETLTPTDLALPLREYMLAQHTYFTDVAGGTVLERFKKDNGFVRNVHSWDYLKNSRHGVESNSRGLLWTNDRFVASIVIAQDFTVAPPQVEGFATKFAAEGRTAGFCVYQPLGLRYITALPAA